MSQWGHAPDQDEGDEVAKLREEVKALRAELRNGPPADGPKPEMSEAEFWREMAKQGKAVNVVTDPRVDGQGRYQTPAEFWREATLAGKTTEPPLAQHEYLQRAW